MAVRRVTNPRATDVPFADADLTADAFNQLATSGYHSMPVVADGKVIGELNASAPPPSLFAMRQLIRVRVLCATGMLDLADFSRLAVKVFTQGEGATKLTARDCMNLSGHNKFVALSKDTTVLKALKAMTLVHQHRVCIARDPKDLTTVFGLLSQIDIINYFLDHIEELGSFFATMTVRELAGKRFLGYKKRPVVTVDAEDSVLYAIQLMDRHAITGVAGEWPSVRSAQCVVMVLMAPNAVLRKGKIVGTVSLADVPFALVCPHAWPLALPLHLLILCPSCRTTC